MTTIAYKDGVIAYDSRASRGDTIQSDTREKAIVKDGVTFVCCGEVPDLEEFIKIWFGAEQEKDLNVGAFVIDKDGVVWDVFCEERLHKSKIVEGESYAMGSGNYHALTAMDMGATAKEAVKMAMKRDPYTGGKVRTIKVKI